MRYRHNKAKNTRFNFEHFALNFFTRKNDELLQNI